MTTRMRLQTADGGTVAVVAATDANGDPIPDPAPLENAPPEEFHVLMVIENQPTGDDRIFTENSLTWRDLYPGQCALSALDTETFNHEDAKLVGNFTRIERQGTELHGYGHFITDPDERAAYLIGLIRTGQLRGFSIGADAVDYELVIEDGGEEAGNEDSMIESEESTDEDGNTVIKFPKMVMRVTEGRVMGGTALMSPAFNETYIEPLSVDTAEEADGQDEESLAASLVASAIRPPVEPPSSWFARHPDMTPTQPPTITEDGRYYGYAALWGSPHIGMPGEVEAPRSAADYAHFHVGEVMCSDGPRVSVGIITMDGNHADKRLSARATQDHYDNTTTGVADVVCGEDENGIWFSGGLRPDVTPEQVRKLMAADLSGDWRHVGAGLELVALHAVNVGGFRKVRASVRQEDGRVLSMVASLSPPHRLGSHPAVARMRRQIAASIGRTPEARRAALRGQVHA